MYLKQARLCMRAIGLLGIACVMAGCGAGQTRSEAINFVSDPREFVPQYSCEFDHKSGNLVDDSNSISIRNHGGFASEDHLYLASIKIPKQDCPYWVLVAGSNVAGGFAIDFPPIGEPAIDAAISDQMSELLEKCEIEDEIMCEEEARWKLSEVAKLLLYRQFDGTDYKPEVLFINQYEIVNSWGE